MPVEKRTHPPRVKTFTNATSVPVLHNLGYEPDPDILDSTGKRMSGDVTHNSTDQFTVAFATPKTGRINY